MRILHILDHSLPLQSGYVFRTLGIIDQQRAFGWEPVLLTSGKHYPSGPERERIGEWEFLRTPRPGVVLSKVPVIRELDLMRNLGKRLDDVIREVGPDILHAHSPALNGLPAIRVGRRHNLPVVYEVRAFWEDAWASAVDGSRLGLRYSATKHLETVTVRHADAVIVICAGLASDLVKRGIPATKITVVPNAVDRRMFTGPAPPDARLAKDLGLAGKTVIGFFGSFYYYEGLHILIKALSDLRQAQPDLIVLLAGGGPEEQRLRSLTKELEISDRVIFVGRVPHEEIRRYYDLVDIFAFPRLSMRLTELVTPLKPLEAMAQQRIVLASNVGGHRELISNQETGYLVPPDDPHQLANGIASALADRSSWPRIRSNAVAYVDKERSWKHSVGRYADVYGRLLKSKAGQR